MDQGARNVPEALSTTVPSINAHAAHPWTVSPEDAGAYVESLREASRFFAVD
jgi:hypothetical protein